MEEAGKQRRGKYTELFEEYQRRGSQAQCMFIEVGRRGIAGKLLCKEEPQRLRKRPQDGCGSRGTNCGLVLLLHRLGTDNSWLGCLV